LERKKENTIPLAYLKRGSIQKIEQNEVKLVGYDEESGTVIVDSSEYSRVFVPGSQWNIEAHDATYHGSQLLNKILGEKRFDFPKSLYAVQDTLLFFVANKPNALILDFFSGSGTTLHAVNLLNAEDGGHRRCIMVTNNEVSVDEEKRLTEKGYKPGDPEWDALGIARYVTWPRTVCSIEGHDVNGKPLKGTYLGSDIPMSEGFQSNAIFFKLGFLDKTSVALGRQLVELFPVLWMKAGAHGTCPELVDESADMVILPENRFAILIDERHFAEFEVQVACHPEIDTLYFVTDSDAGYREMISKYQTKETFQLYKDYLDNFRINTRG
jgi:adenine-specific DNA-methyltransferase